MLLTSFREQSPRFIMDTLFQGFNLQSRKLYTGARLLYGPKKVLVLYKTYISNLLHNLVYSCFIHLFYTYCALISDLFYTLTWVSCYLEVRFACQGHTPIRLLYHSWLSKDLNEIRKEIQFGVCHLLRLQNYTMISTDTALPGM